MGACYAPRRNLQLTGIFRYIGRCDPTRPMPQYQSGRRLIDDSGSSGGPALNSPGDRPFFFVQDAAASIYRTRPGFLAFQGR